MEGKSHKQTNVDRFQECVCRQIPCPQAHPEAERSTGGISQQTYCGPDRGHFLRAGYPVNVHNYGPNPRGPVDRKNSS